MKSRSKQLIRLIKVGLDIGWYANLLFLAITFSFLFYLFFLKPSNKYEEMSAKVRVSGPYIFEKNIMGNSGEVKNAILRTNTAYFSFEIKRGPLVIAITFFFLVAFELLVFSILYSLRMLFTSLNKGFAFTPENVVTLKKSALFIALILPVQFLAYLVQRYFFTMNFPGSYRVSVDPELSFETLVIACVLYIAAEIFNHGLELKREYEEFV